MVSMERRNGIHVKQSSPDKTKQIRTTGALYTQPTLATVSCRYYHALCLRIMPIICSRRNDVPTKIIKELVHGGDYS